MTRRASNVERISQARALLAEAFAETCRPGLFGAVSLFAAVEDGVIQDVEVRHVKRRLASKQRRPMPTPTTAVRIHQPDDPPPTPPAI